MINTNIAFYELKFETMGGAKSLWNASCRILAAPLASSPKKTSIIRILKSGSERRMRTLKHLYNIKNCFLSFNNN